MCESLWYVTFNNDVGINSKHICFCNGIPGGGYDESDVTEYSQENIWEVTDYDSFKTAVTEIKNKRDAKELTEASIVFTQDIEFGYDKHPDEGYTSGSDMDYSYVGQNYFSGIEGVTLTLKSKDTPVTLTNLGATFGSTRLTNSGFEKNGPKARFFTGSMVLDNIKLNTKENTYYFAQGFNLTITENFTSNYKISVVGGNLGKNRRLDGLGFGDADGKGNNGETLGWIKEENGVESTHLEIYGGNYMYIYGGGYNSDVKGDAYVKVALPESNKVDNLFGGSRYNASNGSIPSDGTLAYVKGNAKVDAVSGTFATIYGGSDRGRVNGDAYVNIGAESGDKKALYGEVYGGSNQGVLGTRVEWDWVDGNTHVTLNNTAKERNDTATICGGGQLDTINGTTEVILNGGSNTFWVFAGGSNSDAYNKKSQILNQNKEEVAAKITINGGSWQDIYSCAKTSVSSTASQTIAGDVLVQFNDGTVEYFSLSAHRTHTQGDSILEINGGKFGNTNPAISGYQTGTQSGNTDDVGKVDGKRIVNINNQNQMQCWQIYAVDEINVDNTAPFIARGTMNEGALQSCGNVNIQSGTLALTGTNNLVNTKTINGRDDIKGDFTIAEGGTLALNGTNETFTVPGCINAEGTAANNGKLLVINPKGSSWISTDMTPQRPEVGEVYLRSNATDESAEAESKANLLTLGNNEPDLYVEYTKASEAIGTYTYAWRIAKDDSVKVLTVNFDKNGGDTEASPNKKQVVLSNGAVSDTVDALPTPPKRADYTFTGWNTKADGSGTEFTKDTDVTANITVYAQWEKIVQPIEWYYEVFYQNPDGTFVSWKVGKGGESIPTASVNISEKDFNGQALPGDLGELGDEYVFDADNGNNRLSVSAAQDAAEENPLKIYYKLAPHTVTYEYEGDVPDGAPELPQKVDSWYRAEVTVTGSPSMEGWVFDGWKVKSSEDLTIEDGKLTMPNSDVVLTGVWQKKSTPVEPVSAVYEVEHYKQQDDGTYILADTEFPLYGEIGKTVNATAKVYDGYSVNADKSTMSGEVLKPVEENGEVKYLVLSIYYDKDKTIPPEPEKKTGNLTVSQTVSGNKGDTAHEFAFTVTLSDTSLNGVYGDMTFKDGVASFTLKHGESVTAEKLPAGISYTVEESNNEGYTVTKTGDTGIIEDGATASALFKNYKNEESGDKPVDPEEPETPEEPEKPMEPEEPTKPEEPAAVPSETEKPETRPEQIPRTGDESEVYNWMFLFAASIFGVGATVTLRIKKRRENR